MDQDRRKVIEASHVQKSFGDHMVLEDITMHVCHNEIVSVLGISGSGKTTLFNLISGVSSADSGVIASESKIGYMMQKDLLMPWKTVEENIALPLILKGIPKKAAYLKIGSYLENFGLKGTQKQYPDSLSGGMRQRAALLRTYMISGEVLLLDEPFSSVDAMTRHRLHRWLLSIFNKMELTVLIITHDVEEALLLSDRIYILAENPSRIVDEIALTPKGLANGECPSITDKSAARNKIFEILEKEIDRMDI
ncbi:MAG: ABC transporter ATP-binding protein [Saccharofermentanales bacterium]